MPAPPGTFIWYDALRHESSGGVLQRHDHAQEYWMPDNRICMVFSEGPTMVAGLTEIQAAPSG